MTLYNLEKYRRLGKLKKLAKKLNFDLSEASQGLALLKERNLETGEYVREISEVEREMRFLSSYKRGLAEELRTFTYIEDQQGE